MEEGHARSAERLDCGLYTLVEQLLLPQPKASQCGPSVSRVLSPPLACELQSTGGPGDSAQLAPPASSPACSRESAQLTERKNEPKAKNDGHLES